MSRASRLEPIADFAGVKEADAARRLAAAAQAMQEKEATLERLRGYLAEYRRRAAQDRVSTAAGQWQNSRDFLAKLSDAVAFHERELDKAIEAYRLEAERWRESHRRAQALDKVVERSQREARLEAEQRRQAELDELAIQRKLFRPR